MNATNTVAPEVQEFLDAVRTQLADLEPDAVRNALANLAERELILLHEDGLWRYAPASPVLDGLVEALQTAYRERPVAVINIISKPDPLQSLADAFKFWGRDK